MPPPSARTAAKTISWDVRADGGPALEEGCITNVCLIRGKSSGKSYYSIDSLSSLYEVFAYLLGCTEGNFKLEGLIGKKIVLLDEVTGNTLEITSRTWSEAKKFMAGGPILINLPGQEDDRKIRYTDKVPLATADATPRPRGRRGLPQRRANAPRTPRTPRTPRLRGGAAKAVAQKLEGRCSNLFLSAERSNRSSPLPT